MNHVFKQQVFYSDTDAYGVVWHGSYLRWLEMGRVMLFESAGSKVSELEKSDIVLPVVELNIKYKNSAKLDDVIAIETKIIDYGKFYVTFKQKIINESQNKLYIEADVRVVAINKEGKLYRSLPEPVLDIIKQYCSENVRLNQ